MANSNTTRNDPNWSHPPGPTNISNDVALPDHSYSNTNQMPSSPWRGGEHHYFGLHDTFCFLCNAPSTSPLLNCQTCENAYHATCTLPEESTIPDIWFCDHCVGYGWSEPPIESPDPYPTPRTNSFHPVAGDDRTVADVNTTRKENNPEILSPEKEARAVPQPEAPHPPKPKKHSRPHSPGPQPHRKRKSKYSPYTPEIEKALSVITAELEKTSRTSTSTLTLENTIQTLEQRLRMRDQEIVLLKRERDGLRKEVEKEKEEVKRVEGVLDDVRRDRVAEIRKRMGVEEERNDLKSKVESLEKEGREWRGRLRELVGGEVGV
ncbi:FYVE/PHD zinc finger [Glarea lozoyensis ATCC 20868]|uniref:FYVE/PHD zinc finger n=1 Tax=Glarea lozoyensis (strain ATCC 20868 / MF5171) TaxID=1116229 RepID=S3ECF7_GLAL2|nr:FYVE/PHD zinc finger [Glarea lozoyensis ATCC 20868]EPE35993.1 FYVE/PHD zinc finger [Glarea lozoyensis ATCC 20868]